LGRRVAIFAALATVALALWLATATRDEGDARLSGADRVERPHVARALHGSPVADAREAHPDATATVVAVRAEGEVLISASRDDLPRISLVRAFWRPAGTDGPWESPGNPVARVEQGVARIGGIPLGHDLMVRFGGDWWHAHQDVVLAALTAEAPTVRVDTPRLRPHPVVTCTVLDEGGSPLVSTAAVAGILRVRGEAVPDLFGDLRPIQALNVTTDDRGRLRHPVGPPHHDEFTRWLWIERVHRGSDGRDIVSRAVAALEGRLAAEGETELGRVVLVPVSGHEPEARWVEGTIVADDPSAVKRAHFLVLQPDDRPRGGGWSRSPKARGRMTQGGRFEVLGVGPPPPRLQVHVTARGYAPQDVEVIPPATGVEIQLGPGGRLVAHYLAPTDVPGDRLAGYLQRQGQGASSPNQLPGSFGRDGLVPGRYDVFIKIRGSTWELVRLSGIDVPAGGVAQDPRLEQIDLRPHVRLLKLRLVDGRGATLPEGATIRVEDDAGRGLHVRVGAEGRVAAPVPTAAETLHLTWQAEDSEQRLRADVTWQLEEQEISLF